MRNVLFIVSGPSGAGKGTLVKALMQGRRDLWLSVSLTTRAPRRGEKHGEAYYFVTKEEFEQRIARGEFLEYNNHFENYYGTLLSDVMRELQTRSVILEIEPMGGFQAAEKIRAMGKYPVVLIMITPPSLHALEERINHRGKESAEQMRERRERVAFELAQADRYDYSVLNDDLDTAIGELRAIIDKEINKE